MSEFFYVPLFLYFCQLLCLILKNIRNSQLCPLYPHNPEVLLNELKSPSDLLDFGEFSNCMNFSTQDGTPLLNVVNPTFDYVPSKLVSLFVTDT
jgi:translation initiation factor eIF-2B subunit beta